MPKQTSEIRSIFCQALDLDSPAAVAEYLDQACDGDAELRKHVEELIEVHRGARDFLGSSETKDTAVESRDFVGIEIGPYKLLEVIGEGGMGTVYMAEQTEPVQRRVALKVIKTGMDTRQVIARFEAERQALALMDHPNIAKVLDAGSTESGRPYFVMELVKGVPITQFCDEQRLDTESRLKLFQKVCHAVQHAHQKGIIHRDLKPSNVLVAMYDDQPVPKVIDFGVAKATGEQLTEQTMFTRYGQIVGTLEYMSPEQAQFNNLDIDTRSDIYSLGAILYELLAGEPPFERERLKSQALDETLRMIREEEPTRPSTRLSSIRRAARSAADRQTTPEKLGSMLKGDLDWIVMKALEKDRARRYASASALSEDVERYLVDEPVVACPPTIAYRLRKFATRNSVGLAAGAIIVAMLIVATGVSAWFAFHAIRAEASAKREGVITSQVQQFWNEAVLGQADPVSQHNRDVLLREALVIASDRIEEKAFDDPMVEAAIRQAIVTPLVGFGDLPRTLNHRKRILEIYSKQLGPNGEETINATRKLGDYYLNTGQFDLADEFLTRALNVSEQHLGPNHKITLHSLSSMGVLHKRRGDYKAAFELFRKALAGYEEYYPSEPEMSLNAKMNCAVALAALDQNDEAIDLLRSALDYANRTLMPNHPATLHIRNNLAQELVREKRFNEAIREFEQLIEINQNTLGQKSFVLLGASIGLGQAYWFSGNIPAAEQEFERSYLIQREFHPKHSRGLVIPACLIALFAESRRESDAARVMNEVNQLDLDPQTLVNFAATLRDLAEQRTREGNSSGVGYLCDQSIQCLVSIEQLDVQSQIVGNLDGWIVLLRQLDDQDRLMSTQELRIERYEMLYGKEPRQLDHLVILAGQYCDLATNLYQAKRFTESLDRFRQARQLLNLARDRNTTDLRAQQFLEITLFQEAACLTNSGQHQAAIENLDLLLAQELVRLDALDVKLRKAIALAEMGEYEAGINLLESPDVLDKCNTSVRELWAARTLHGAAVAAKADPSLTPGEQADLSEEYARKAVEHIEKAIRLGDVEKQYLTGGDFSGLQDRADFVNAVKLWESSNRQESELH